MTGAGTSLADDPDDILHIVNTRSMYEVTLRDYLILWTLGCLPPTVVRVGCE
jgi:hypothetical protein